MVQSALPVTLFTGQWADLPLEEVARLAAEWGYDGLEIACSGDHLDVWRAAEDDAYLDSRRAVLDKHGLKLLAISNHLAGQAVCDDPIDFRHEAIVRPRVWGCAQAGYRHCRRIYGIENLALCRDVSPRSGYSDRRRF
jgi:sugar phosphate isomerase/epimerase